jgi:hypothetical protein|tara:strand:+ start:1879 stop:2553 length:675 start_codon:yes stop_codon:yes gene_type:complete
MDINNQAQSYQGLLNMLNGKPANDIGSSSQQRIVDSLPYSSNSSADSVSLSYKGAKLGMISAEYFSGTVKSTDIPKLTERLYQDGFINESEYRALGGVKADEPTSQIAQSVNFLNDFIMGEIVDGDSEGAKSLMLAVDSLQNMDEQSSLDSRRKETEAYEFVSGYTELLKETNAPSHLIKGFEQVLQVFEALDTVRKNELQTGALASYASVQDTFNDYQDKKDS